MNFEGLEFKTVVTGRRFNEAFFRFNKKGSVIRLTLSIEAVKLANGILNGYNNIELMVSGDSIIAIRPKIKAMSKNNKSFTVTGLNGKIKNIPFNKRITVSLYKDMIVCDLRK